MSKIAVMGYGTVGSGVVEVILNNRDLIAKKADEPIDIKYVLDLRDFPGSVIEDWSRILRLLKMILKLKLL